MKKFYGTGVALVTPFFNSGKIDFKSLRKILDHTSQSVDYWVVMGTTGESATLSNEEKKEVLDFVIKNNSKKKPIVCGIGGNNTAKVIEEIKTTNLDGVDALLSVAPYYNKPSQEGIFQHFAAIADSSPLPIILYNVPTRTSINISAETTVRLSKLKNIIGIKEASCDLVQCMTILRDKHPEFIVISGDDIFTLPLYSLGGSGVISVLANAIPQLFEGIKNASQSGRYAEAHKDLFDVLELNKLLYEEGNPVGIKQLLHEMNLCTPKVRLPLANCSEKLSKQIKTSYNRYKERSS